ncbi:MAG: DEAD/DEAH box helicase [Caulobacteraceae bacterium]
MTQFTDLGLAQPLLRALQAEGYDTPTPIQAQAIPTVMQGRDLLGIAQTGTGKTAAFALPILHRLAADKQRPPRRGCRVLVLSPTRELASQIADSFRAYGRFMGVTVAVVFGGAKINPQIKALANGVDVLVATPGRLIDHLQQHTCHLGETEIFVLDEADQMLDLGFILPIRKIVAKLPAHRQNLFFSATMPTEIGKLAGELLKDPAKVSVAPESTTVERVEQSLLFVEALRKRALLAELFAEKALNRVIVFTRTKRGADRVARYLEASGVSAASIHGDKSQPQRERALAAFKAGACRALVATDIAARGIDVDSVSHVINYELPNVPESYVHRIGRTARAGATGLAISLCSDDERNLLKDIQKVTRQTIPSFDRRNDTRLGQATAMADKLVPKDAGKGEDPIYGQKQGKPRGESRGGGGRHGQGRPQGGQGHGHGQGRARHDGQQAGPSGEARGETQGRGAGPNRNRRRRPGGGGGAKTPMSGSWSPTAG